MKVTGYLGREALKLYSELDPVLAKRAVEFKATCQRGCSHCCSYMTFMSLPEALAIAEHLLRSDWDLDELVKGMAQQAELLRDPNVVSVSYRHPCAFLKERECSIYEVRPFACRALYVASHPSKCGGGINSIVAAIDMLDITDRFSDVVMTTTMKTGFAPFVAPLEVIIPFALRLLTEGRAPNGAPGDPTGLTYWLELAGTDEARRRFTP